jgi:hypothetical protein
MIVKKGEDNERSEKQKKRGEKKTQKYPEGDFG